MRKTTAVRRSVKAVIDSIGRFDESSVYDHYADDNVFPYVRIVVFDGVVTNEFDTEKEIRVRIEIFDKADNATEIIEDTIDEHAYAIEQALKADSTLGNTVEYIVQTDFDNGVDPENAIAMAGLNYKCKYDEE